MNAAPTNLTPVGFEQWCERRLARLGWTAVATKLTGDQGADVLAEKNGFRVVVQCKYYSSPVGNKSVQEVYAARQHYRYDAAAVVTNSGYTPSARALAGSTGVALLTVHDLDRFDYLVGAPQRALSSNVDVMAEALEAELKPEADQPVVKVDNPYGLTLSKIPSYPADSRFRFRDG